MIWKRDGASGEDACRKVFRVPVLKAGSSCNSRGGALLRSVHSALRCRLCGRPNETAVVVVETGGGSVLNEEGTHSGKVLEKYLASKIGFI